MFTTWFQQFKITMLSVSSYS
ncbi:7 transmembrane receptor [Trichinella spiralis]|nr:7 transmembrane receptor [Trichinella spiralis]